MVSHSRRIWEIFDDRRSASAPARFPRPVDHVSMSFLRERPIRKTWTDPIGISRIRGRSVIRPGGDDHFFTSFYTYIPYEKYGGLPEIRTVVDSAILATPDDPQKSGFPRFDRPYFFYGVLIQKSLVKYDQYNSNIFTFLLFNLSEPNSKLSLYEKV